MLHSWSKRVLQLADRHVQDAASLALPSKFCNQGRWSSTSFSPLPSSAIRVFRSTLPCDYKGSVRTSCCQRSIDGNDAVKISEDGGREKKICSEGHFHHPVDCDMTFCPPERAQHCRLAMQQLPQPRGDESLMRPQCLRSIKRSLKFPQAYQALLVDAAGTLIATSQSTEEVYRRIGLKYGIKFSEEEIAAKFKEAYGHPWCRYKMRYEEDGRQFWQKIVQEATGCKDPGLLHDLYEYYTTDKAWHIGDPNAEKALRAIRSAGIKLAVVSNFDTRLRPLMKVLHCYDWFDAIIVSAEVGVEKPNPEIFLMACKELGVQPAQVLHVGDDKTNDIVGASSAGCDALLWGEEVSSFAEVAKKLGVEVPMPEMAS